MADKAKATVEPEEIKTEEMVKKLQEDARRRAGLALQEIEAILKKHKSALVGTPVINEEGRIVVTIGVRGL